MQISEQGSSLGQKPTKLFNKNFLLLWQGQLISQIGTQAFSIAMLFWIKHATGSATLVGILLMLSNIPAVLLGPIAGTFADRHSRRNILIICDFLSGLVVLSLVALMLLAPQEQTLIITWLFITSVFVAILQAFFRPAITASIPDIVPVEKLQSANSLKESSFQISTLLGQGLGGVLYSLMGAPLLFLINGISFVFAAFSEIFVQIPQTIAKKSNSWKELLHDFKGDIKEGFQYVWGRKGMKNFFLAVAILNFFSVPFTVLLPFFVEDFLHLGTDWFGFLIAGFGAGALLGYLLASTIRLSPKQRSLVIMSMLIGVAGGLTAFSFITDRWIALAILSSIGIMSGVINITIISILQMSTPSYIRGRVFGLLGTLAAGLIPIAMGLAGVVADMLDQNIPLIYFWTGFVATLLSILISLSKEFRIFLAYESSRESQPEEFSEIASK